VIKEFLKYLWEDNKIVFFLLLLVIILSGYQVWLIANNKASYNSTSLFIAAALMDDNYHSRSKG